LRTSTEKFPAAALENQDQAIARQEQPSLTSNYRLGPMLLHSYIAVGDGVGRPLHLE